MEPLFHIPPPAWRVNKVTGFADIVTPHVQLFYHDLSAEEAEEWVAQLTPQSLKALFEGGEHSYAGWLDVPVWYVGTIEDQGRPALVLRMHVGLAREMGARVVHRELRSSHSPFLSQSDEVVELLVEAMGAFMCGNVGAGGFQSGAAGENIMTPEVSVWKPSSWLKYCLLLMLGHFIGRCILICYGIRGLWQSARNPSVKAD